MQTRWVLWIATGTLSLAVATAQSMLEHAAVAGPAAAGSSAGAAAGSKLGTILGAAAGTTKESAKQGTKKTDPHPAAPARKSTHHAEANVPDDQPYVIPGRTPPTVWTRDMASRVPSVPSPAAVAAAQTATAAPKAVPAPPAISREDLLHAIDAVQTGWSRAELLAKVGAPEYRISMADGSGLLERFRFSAGGAPLATIELHDGVVRSVSKYAQ